MTNCHQNQRGQVRYCSDFWKFILAAKTKQNKKLYWKCPKSPTFIWGTRIVFIGKKKKVKKYLFLLKSLVTILLATLIISLKNGMLGPPSLHINDRIWYKQKETKNSVLLQNKTNIEINLGNKRSRSVQCKTKDNRNPCGLVSLLNFCWNFKTF